MIELIIIVIIIFIVYKATKKNKSTRQYTFNSNLTHQQNSVKEYRDEAVNSSINKMKVSSSTSTNSNSFENKSIIDVTGESFQINTIQYYSGNNHSDYDDSQQTQNTDYLYDFRLGNKYEDELKLSTEEVSWLNKFWNPTNVFLSIEGCNIPTIKLYLNTLKELIHQLELKDSNLEKELKFFQDECVKERNIYDKTSDFHIYSLDNSYIMESVESDFFLTIFKKSENAVRELYGHKRKISSDFPASNQFINNEFEIKIGSLVNEIIKSLITCIELPDRKTEIELNAQNVNRWKLKFDKLVKDFSNLRKQEFINGIYDLEKLNQKNLSIENIFYEASKFISKHDKTEALRFYLYYLHYDLKSLRINNKKFNKTIQKVLFTSNEQLHSFDEIIVEFVKTKNLQKALTEVTKVYLPKRKIVNLDASKIDKVKNQDKGMVELLNEFLQDDFEDEYTSVKSTEINNDEIKLIIKPKNEDENDNSKLKSNFSLDEIQTNALDVFLKNSFKIHSSEFEKYCQSKGVLKNQLINSINETCYDLLEDVLIEEDEDYYIINDMYFKKIFE